MTKILLNSSNLKSAEYDEQTQQLVVEFNRGGMYKYLEVPPDVFTKLIDSKSAGVYFAHNIRNKYPTVKM